MNIWLAVVCMLWLAWAAWQDVRTKEVSNWLTIPPLFGVALWWLARGEWRVIALLVILVGIVETMDRRHIYPAAAIVLAVSAGAGVSYMAAAQVRLILIAWSALWAIWVTQKAGGADVKVVMALLALYPDWRLAVLLVAAYVVWSIYYLVRRHGRRALRVALANMFNSPTEEELAASGVPTVPAFAAAGWLYLLSQLVVGL